LIVGGAAALKAVAVLTVAEAISASAARRV
jgi:hypothetical protein